MPAGRVVSHAMFKVANGQILDPAGKPFLARGINVRIDQLPVVTPAALKAFFPQINIVRLYYEGATNPYGTATEPYVSALTSAGIVVLIEDHTGISKPPYTGAQLAAELAWYSALAARYKANAYVWFGTFNEPGAGTNLAAIATQEAAIYQAIRAAGNGTIVAMELPSGGNPGLVGAMAKGYDGAGPMTPALFASMTNIVWDLHYYGWVSKYSTDPAVVAAALKGSVAGAQGILGAQSITSADGVVPVIIGEFGNSTTGVGIDVNANQVIAAVGACGLGWIAWAWDPDPDGDQAVRNGQLTAYGKQVAALMATQTVTKGTWRAGVLTNGPKLPSGSQMRYAYLPADASATGPVPVLIWLHTNDAGNRSYPNGDPIQVATISGADGWFNTLAFRARGALVIVPSCDQTTDTGGTTENFGGYGPINAVNEQSLVLLAQYAVSGLGGDPTRLYVAGGSLGGIAAWGLAVDHNAKTGTISRTFAAFLAEAGMLVRAGVTPASVLTQLHDVPIFAVHGLGDVTSPIAWDRGVWDAFSGNKPRPGAPGAQAGSSAFHYLEDPNLGHDVWDTYAPAGAGSGLYAWLFSQSSSGAVIVPTTPVFVTTTNGLSVKDAAGATWTLAANGVTLINGAVAAGGSGTAQLTSISGIIWAQDVTTKAWFSYAGGQWTPGTLPTTPPPPPPPPPNDPTVAILAALDSVVTQLAAIRAEIAAL